MTVKVVEVVRPALNAKKKAQLVKRWGALDEARHAYWW